MADSVLRPIRPIFRAIATTIVPDAAQLDEPAWTEMEQIMDDALASRPPRLRRQLGVFLRGVQLLPILRYGQPFTALDAARRTRVLAGLEHSPLLLVRRGVWGVRTLVFMGFYGRPEEAAAIGYHANPRGWEARR